MAPMGSQEAQQGSEWLGRAGFAAKGVVYGIVGIIAIAVALGGEKSTADQTGALASLAGSTAGKLLLIALALGLAAYAAFRLLEVIRGVPGEDGGSEVVERIASLVRAVVYAALSVSAARIVLDAGGKSGGNEQQTTSTVFDLPAGVALVLIGGLVIIGVGLYQASQALSSDFEEDLETARMSASTRSLARWLGTAGHAARAVVFVLIGGFLVKAAVEQDSKEAIGLDGALQEVAQQSFGAVLLLLVAAGLFVYGAYCLIEARYHRF